MTELNPRITVEAGKMGGKPCIRGLRITVCDLASYLASGMTEEEILREFPYLEKEDFHSMYEFFASIPEANEACSPYDERVRLQQPAEKDRNIPQRLKPRWF